MDFKTYREYAAIEDQIRKARLEGVIATAHVITEFLMDCWNAIKAPPAPPAILPIDRRQESRSDVSRASGRFAHR